MAVGCIASLVAYAAHRSRLFAGGWLGDASLSSCWIWPVRAKGRARARSGLARGRARARTRVRVSARVQVRARVRASVRVRARVRARVGSGLIGQGSGIGLDQG